MAATLQRLAVVALVTWGCSASQDAQSTGVGVTAGTGGAGGSGASAAFGGSPPEEGFSCIDVSPSGDPPPGMFSCGDISCTHGSEFCQIVNGYASCEALPEACTRYGASGACLTPVLCTAAPGLPRCEQNADGDYTVICEITE